MLLHYTFVPSKELEKLLNPMFIKVLYNKDVLNLNDKKAYSIVLCDDYDVWVTLKQSMQYVDYLFIPNVNESRNIFEKVLLLQKSFLIRKVTSVIVFDLDETLLLKGDLVNVNHIVCLAKKCFNKVVLWSHGTTDHVIHHLRENINLFDLIISRSGFMQDDRCPNKGIGFLLKQLNKKFNITTLTTTCLVDNDRRNFKNDYDMFIHVPEYALISDIDKFLITEMEKQVRMQNYI